MQEGHQQIIEEFGVSLKILVLGLFITSGTQWDIGLPGGPPMFREGEVQPSLARHLTRLSDGGVCVCVCGGRVRVRYGENVE